MSPRTFVLGVTTNLLKVIATNKQKSGRHNLTGFCKELSHPVLQQVTSQTIPLSDLFYELDAKKPAQKR